MTTDPKTTDERLAAENGIDLAKRDHLNKGQIRMNLGNVLPVRWRKNGEVRIGGRLVK